MRDFGDGDTMEFHVPLIQTPFDTPSAFSSMIRIEFGVLSDVGKVRPNNEDAFVIYRVGRFWENLMTNLHPGDLPSRYEENGYAMVVADGMGGQAAGEVASSMAIQVCVNLVLQSPRWAIKLDNPETRDEEIAAAKERAQQYFQKIDAALLDYARDHPRFKGMGTTLTGAYSVGDDLFIMHIGDSRAYLFRQNHLQRLTTDHTLAQLMVRTGDLTAEQAFTHRFRHTLTSCLGGQEAKIQVDIHNYRLIDGDCLLLCTDGLTDMVDENTVAETLSEMQTPQQTCDRLIQLALEKGGNDNITAIIARYHVPERPEMQTA